MPRLSILTILAMGLALVACGGRDSKATALEDTLEAYGATIRWGDFRSAANFLHPDERPEASALSFQLQRFEQVRVTGYQRVGQGVSGASDSYVQIVEIRVANRHTARERTIQDRQIWRYDAAIKHWWLVSGLPDISRR